MGSSAVYATQVSGGRYPDGQGNTSPSLTPSSRTLVDEPHYIERPSIELKFSSSGAKIVNSTVVGPADRPLYSISSNSKCTKLLSQRDNTEVATVEWGHFCPRMVFRGKKMKCKEWLRLAKPETDSESRLLVHGDTQFTWMQQSSSGFLIPTNRPGLAVAKWQTESGSDELHLKIFQVALVEPGLLEAIVLSIVLLQSGNSFGDRPLSVGGSNYYTPLGCNGSPWSFS